MAQKPKNKAEAGLWNPVAVVRKWDREGNFIEEVRSEGNILTEVGRARLADLIVGTATGALVEGNVRLGVGDLTDIADPADTNLSASTNEYYQIMDGGNPISVDGVVSFVATFDDDEANFSWQCWGIDVDDAGSVTAGDTPVELFNRKVFNFGEKDGGTWQLTVTVSAFTPSS